MKGILSRAWAAVLALALLCTLLPRAMAAGSSPLCVGYYAGWASLQGYAPDRIPAEQLTHVHYAFAKIDGETGAIALPNPATDRANLAGLRAQRSRNPKLKVLISVGGWDYSTHFSAAAATARSRETFAQSCLELILEHGLDGIDLDWEYPVSGGMGDNSYRPQDKQNFTLLLKAIRRKLDAQGRRDGKTYLLTIASGTTGGLLNNMELTAVADTVDYIFMMSYDLHGPWDRYADLNAPLYAPKESSPQYKHSVYDGIQAFLRRGVAPSKLVLGIPLYGYRYEGVRGSGLYSAFSSAASVSYNTIRRSYLSSSAYRQLRHGDAQVPYLMGNGTFLTYDDPQSVAAKASLAKTSGLAGVGFWELSQDSSGALLSSAAAAFSGGFSDVGPGDWFFTPVTQAAEEGWMDGTAPGVFSPQAATSRGMMAVLLHRLEGAPAAFGASPFSDVAEGAYFRQAVVWAQRERLLQGYSDGRFRPDRAISRQELAALLFRYAAYRGHSTGRRADLGAYRDAGQISDYARPALEWAVAEGLLTGRGGNTLSPGGTATRAETAAVLVRLQQLLSGR